MVDNEVRHSTFLYNESTNEQKYILLKTENRCSVFFSFNE